MVVLNWRYPECQGGFFNSPERDALLTEYFAGIPQDADPTRLVENALSMAPLVNSWETMHSLIFKPTMDQVALSWDNGHAPNQPWQRLAMSEVFGDLNSVQSGSLEELVADNPEL
jgi:hypothetical protein